METTSSSLLNKNDPPQSYSPIPPDDDNEVSKEVEEEYEEVNLKGTTPLQTFFAIFKGNVGPGCLSLPWAFSILGIPLGCAITAVITYLVSYNAWTLVRLKRTYLKDGKRGVTYSDVGERAYGTKFRIVVDLSVILLQMAVCTIFISNMAENTSTMIRHTFLSSASTSAYTSAWQFLQHERVIMTILLLPACTLLSSLPNLKALAPSIALASVLMFASFLLIGYIIYHDWSHGYQNYQNSNGIPIQWSKVPLATCAIMYALEGDQLILPIEAAMMHPRKHFTKTFVWSMAGICLLFCVFASCCVVAFGFVDDGSITAFLVGRIHNNEGDNVVLVVDDDGLDDAWDSSSTSRIAFLANAVVSVSLLFTYPLQLFPVLGLVGQIVARKQRQQQTQTQSKEHYVAITEQDNDKEKKDKVSDVMIPHEEKKDNNKIINEKDEEIGSLNDNDDDSMNGAIEMEQVEQNYDATKLPTPASYQNQTQQKQQQITEEDFFQDGLDIEGDSLLMRFTLVFLTYASAMIVPQLRLLIALGGAITGSMTSLIIPPLLALKFVSWKEDGSSSMGWSWWSMWYGGLISVGLVYAYIGTAASIRDIIEVYTGSGEDGSL